MFGAFAAAERARHEYIHRGHLLPVHPERFADQAPQAIAVDRIARRANADGHAEPRFAGFIARNLNGEQGIRMTFAPLSRALELGGGVEFLAGPQSVTPGRRSLVSVFR